MYYIGLAIVTFGSILMLISAIGCLRMRDSYLMMHAAGVADSCGAPIVLIGLILVNGFSVVSLKLAILVLLIIFLSPTATHSLANSRFNQEGRKK